jgi:hypothetical protein
MPKKGILIGIVALIGMALISCDNETNGITRTVDPALIGKWEVKQAMVYGTLYTLPATFSGTKISSMGYYVTANSAILYANGFPLYHYEGIYTIGNGIFSSGGVGGLTYEISGNNITLTSIDEIDYGVKVSKFSWE